MTFGKGMFRGLGVVMFAILLAACGGAEDRKAAHMAKGEEFLAAENYEKARLEFKNVLQIDPEDVAARFALAETAEKLQNLRGAVGNYLRVVELDPNHIEARIKLGQIYMLGRAFDKSGEQVEAVLVLEPENVDALALRGGLKAAEGDEKGARADGEKSFAVAARACQQRRATGLAGAEKQKN